MTELKTAAEIRQMIADKRSAVRSGIDLTKVYEKLNDRLENLELSSTSIRLLAKSIRPDVDIPDEEWRDSLQFIFDEIQIKLEDNGYTVRPQYGLGFGSTPPRIGLVIYWDPRDLPDGGAEEKE